jgi:hypothetical protein
MTNIARIDTQPRVSVGGETDCSSATEALEAAGLRE